MTLIDNDLLQKYRRTYNKVSVVMDAPCSR